ncbi:toll/interleukin-1 receptor domain-containing protein [Vibrio sp. 10N.286.51.E5]|uniref:toll/interleukin-1 receptor domain-containing protein n=1 Tax=Vibrio sp. 10N.286.51.E5 TaxID=3229709 RepID=UPI00355345E8
MIQYDVVISFAGEDRHVAEEIASSLVTKGINVFYDEYEQANLWGKDLYEHLIKIYRDESKYCLMVLSKNYVEKQWTNHERKAAQARAFREHREYILPLRLDDTEVEGILDTTGYIDYRKVELEQLIDMLASKVFEYNQDHGIEYEIVKVEDVFRHQGIAPKGGEAIKDKHMTTTCPACNKNQKLDEASLSLEQDETIYTCKNGCQPIVVVGRPGIVAWPGRGYRLGDHVIRNVKDVLVKTNDMAVPIVLDGRQAALMKTRPKAS